MFIFVANKLYTRCVLYSLHANLEDDGLTANCDMSNKNTFRKYFVGNIKYFYRKKNTGTLNRFLLNTGYSLNRKSVSYSKLKCFFSRKNSFSFSFKGNFRGTRSLRICKYLKFWNQFPAVLC